MTSRARGFCEPKNIGNPFHEPKNIGNHSLFMYRILDVLLLLLFTGFFVVEIRFLCLLLLFLTVLGLPCSAQASLVSGTWA